LLPKGFYISSGSITLGPDKLELVGMPEKDRQKIRGRRISIAFQEPMSSLDPLVKVGKQIAEPLFIHGLAKNRAEGIAMAKAAMDLAGLAGIDSIESYYAHQLSGGMRQRVILAMALACSPEVLIADEPTSAIDAPLKAKILETLKSLNKQTGLAILLITHDISVVRSICDLAFVMYSGMVIESGKAADVCERPKHEYTKGLLGALPTADKKGSLLPTIPREAVLGEVPQGCPFANRCKMSRPVCHMALPKMHMEGDHMCLCHFAKENSRSRARGDGY